MALIGKKGDKSPEKKKPESVRERAERVIEEASKPKKTPKIEKKAKTSKYLKVPKRLKRTKKNKTDKKPRRFHFTPKFLRQAFAELKLVTWPNASTTFKLTTAVIIFATIFALFVSLVDYAFGHLFKRIFLHG